MTSIIANANKITYDHCLQFQKNSTINPLTGKGIKQGGETWTILKEICDNMLANPEKLLNHYILNGTIEEMEAFINDPANAIDLTKEIDGIPAWFTAKDALPVSTRYDRLMLIDNYLAKTMTKQERLTLYTTMHYKGESIMDFIKLSANRIEAMKKLPVYRFLLPYLTSEEVTNIQIGKITLAMFALTTISGEDLALQVIRKQPSYTPSEWIHLLMVSAKNGSVNVFTALVKEFNMNPNHVDTDDWTPLAYALGYNMSEDVIQSLLNDGACPYAIISQENQIQSIIDLAHDTPSVLMLLYDAFKKDIAKILNSNIYITSDTIAINLIQYIDMQPSSLSIEDKNKLLESLYMFTGASTKSIPQDKSKTRWLSDEMLRSLKVKVNRIGEYKRAKYSQPYDIYEIVLYSELLQRVVGVIGNFIPHVTSDMRLSNHEITNVRLIEKGLQKLHDKGKLLLKSFPYRSKLDLIMYDEFYIDLVRLEYPNASYNNEFFGNKSAYYNMLLSIKSALENIRYVPTFTHDVVRRAYSKTFMPMMKTQKDTFTKDELKTKAIEDIVKRLAKSLTPITSNDKKTASISSKDNKQSTIQKPLSNTEKSHSKVVTNSKRSELQSINSIETNIKTKQSSTVSRVNSSRKKEALNKIATFAKKRTSKLTQFFEDSMAYMDSLPKEKRIYIYRAVTGQIMQGPYSPIKRVQTLLYAKRQNAFDVMAMVEIVMRAPRFPMRYSLFRGMALPETPVIGETTVYQEIPFSTTFISNYALGWVLAKKRTSCCLLELQCHTGTGGLFLSKLPWMDPWTSINSAIFQRIAPSNTKTKAHIKVNAQNEFLMQPYKLVVVGKRTKNFKHMFEEQIEKIDTHYEYDASQRAMTSLFKNNDDLLDREIDVYQVRLEPISLYYVEISNDIALQFEPSNLLPAYKYRLNVAREEYQYIFFTPEEIPPETLQKLEQLTTIHKLIEKGRYVGPKTF